MNLTKEDAEKMQNSIIPLKERYYNDLYDLEDAYIETLKEIFIIENKQELTDSEIDFQGSVRFFDNGGDLTFDYPRSIYIDSETGSKNNIYVVSCKGYKLIFNDLEPCDMELIFNSIIGSIVNKEDEIY